VAKKTATDPGNDGWVYTLIKHMHITEKTVTVPDSINCYLHMYIYYYILNSIIFVSWFENQNMDRLIKFHMTYAA
jgi:hypothetical protein